MLVGSCFRCAVASVSVYVAEQFVLGVYAGLVLSRGGVVRSGFGCGFGVGLGCVFVIERDCCRFVFVGSCF